jgi:hypothetical protein
MVNSYFCERLFERALAKNVENGEKRIVLVGPTVAGETMVDLFFEGTKIPQQCLRVDGLENDLILGLDFITTNAAIPDFEVHKFKIQKFHLVLDMSTKIKALNQKNLQDSELVTVNEVQLDPQSEQIIQVKCAVLDPLASATRIGFAEDARNDESPPGIVVHPGLVKLRTGFSRVVLANMTDETRFLAKETCVANLISTEVRPCCKSYGGFGNTS